MNKFNSVVYIGNEYCILSPLNIFRNFAAISGSEGAKPDPRLIIINQNYFAKNKPDAFSNPKLIKFLNEHKINQVLITGVYAEACVFQTIKGAIKNGLQPILVRDGVGSKTQQKRQKYFEKYGEIVWMIDAHQIISYSEVTIVEPLPPWLMFPCPFSMAWRQGTGERWLHWEFRLFWDAMTPEQRQIYLTKWPIPDDDWYFFLFHEPRTTSDN